MRIGGERRDCQPTMPFIFRSGVWNGISQALSYPLRVMMANFGFGKQDQMVYGGKWRPFLLIIIQHPYHDTNIPFLRIFYHVSTLLYYIITQL